MNKELYRKALNQWGVKSQLFLAIEEFGELISALSRDLNGRAKDPENLLEEIADAEIMLEQLRIIYDEYRDQIDNHKEEKLQRLQELLTCSDP